MSKKELLLGITPSLTFGCFCSPEETGDACMLVGIDLAEVTNENGFFSNNCGFL